MAAAADLIESDGYAGVTAAALSARTGMPHSTIYDVVGDPHDLVAVWTLRVLDEMHQGMAAYAAQVATREEAIEFVRVIVAAYFESYLTDSRLRAALSGIDGDPEYRWIHIADSRRNADVISEVISRYADDPPEVVAQRTMLMAHLTGAAAAMAFDLGGDEAREVVAAFDYLIESMLRP